MNAASIAENLAAVRARIAAAAARAGRPADAVQLVAVTKQKPSADIRAALTAGQADFGENYVQELLAKQDELADAAAALRWHAIGPLQRNKVRQVVGRVALLHAVDSARLLDEIDRRSAAAGVVTPVLLQVDSALEPTKSGCPEAELPALAHHALCLPAVALRGLMTLPPFFDDPEETRPFFARLRALRDALVAQHGVPAERLTELSMGMSGDYEVAVEEGATLVRVGSAIFGERGQEGVARTMT
jgi:hypothetical protein